MRHTIAPAICAAAFAVGSLALSGCSTNVSYRPLPNMRVSVPVHMPYPGTARLPGGHGGTKKTGRPYRVAGRTYYPLASAAGYDRTGIASWYGRKFHGRKTANGERYDMYALSAAHKTLPLPTLVRVTNLENGRQVIVRVNDRGPYVKNRLIDLSYAAARQLGFAGKGTARVRVQALQGVAPATLTAKRSARSGRGRAVIHTIPRPVAPANRVMGGMYVQLGAFSSQANAYRLKRSLAARYPDIHVRAFRHAAGMLYRVRIGPYSDPGRIEQAVLALKDSGFPNVIVVIE